MGRIVDLEINFDSLLRFAESAYDRGDLVAAVLNLNEAKKIATERDQFIALYNLYVKCFRNTGNSRPIIDAVGKEISYSHEEDFYRFDFSRRDGDIAEEDEDISYEDIKKYNTVRNLIYERRYEEAMNIIVELPSDMVYVQSVIDALIQAVECDKKLNLDKFVVPLLGLIAGAPNQAEMVGLMLDGGRATHNIMVDSADYLLEEEDTNVLCMMGMAYFKGNEPRVAKRFFEKTIIGDPLDQDALYYLTAIAVLLKDEEGRKKYWDRYKALYAPLGAPVRIMEDFFDSDYKDFVVPYLTLPSRYLAEVSEELLSVTHNGDIDEVFAERFYEYAIVASDRLVGALMYKIGKVTADKEVLIGVYKKLLATAYTTMGVKQIILDKLVDDGYEGELTVVTENKVVCFTLTKIHRRVDKNWELIYRLILRNLPFSSAYIPLRCSVLSAIVKKLDTIFRPESDEDFTYALTMAVINYIDKLKLNVDMFALFNAMHVDPEIMERGAKKFNIDKLFI